MVPQFSLYDAMKLIRWHTFAPYVEDKFSTLKIIILTCDMRDNYAMLTCEINMLTCYLNYVACQHNYVAC